MPMIGIQSRKQQIASSAAALVCCALLPFMLVSCQSPTRPRAATPPAIYDFTVAEDGSITHESSGLKIMTFRQNGPTSLDGGVVVPQQPKPGSPAAKMERHVEVFSQQEPTLYGDLASQAETGAASVPHISLRRSATIGRADIEEYRQLEENIKVFTGSGPYRRVLAKPGYSYVDGDVFLPCRAARLRTGYETGFVYVGGWGAGTTGKAVDAGFQHSAFFDDYSVMIRAQDYKQVPGNPRLSCGHFVAFQFYAASNTELKFVARGRAENVATDAHGGKRIEPIAGTKVIVAHLIHKASYGWPADGGGNYDGIVLKRMTTIGQKNIQAALSSDSSWDRDNSYFGHYPQGKNPEVKWSNLRLGRIGERGQLIGVVPWDAAHTYSGSNGEIIDYPDDASIVWHSCIVCPNEADAIDLSR